MRKVRHWGWAALLMVLLVSFCVHAVPAFMPGASETELAAYRDENGETYMTEMDSYFYLRLSREMAEAGAPFMYNLRSEDPLMYQRPVPENGQGLPVLLSVLGWCVWRVLSLFCDVTVQQVARWMGPVLGSLSAVPAFLYVRRRTNLAGGVTAALLTALGLPFLAHTHAGFFDTDMLLGILPLGFVLAELRAMQEKRLLKQVLYGAGAGLLLALLSLTWFAFYTYFWLMALGGLIGVILTLALTGRCPLRRRLAVIRGWLASVVSALLLVLLFRGKPGLEALTSVFSIFRSVSGSSDSFPFTHQFTGEMQPLSLFPSSGSFWDLFRADLSSGLGCLGGILPVLLMLLALPLGIAFALRGRKNVPADQRYDALIASLTEAGILLLWLGFGVVLMRSRRRFTEIAALPTAILAGLAVGFAVKPLKRLKAAVRIPARAALAAVACLPMALGSVAYARSTRPGVADSLNDAMVMIRETQPEDAAIASWWDFGYFMQYTARRRAIADGGSTSSSVYWFLAKALLTDDPAQTAGILRMLETSGNKAMWDLIGMGAAQADAANWLLDAVRLSREDAAKMKPPVSMSEAEFSALLDLTHPAEQKPLLLVLGSDLLAKSDALSWYGFWDLYNTRQQETIYWLAGEKSEILEPGSETVFRLADPSILLTVTKDSTGHIEVSQTAGGLPYRLSRLCVWRDGVQVQDADLGGSGPATVLVEEEGRTAVFSCSPNLCDSMLVRLFVCGDRSIPGITLAGSWYGIDFGDPSPAQRRMMTADPALWCTQVWQVSESLYGEIIP